MLRIHVVSVPSPYGLGNVLSHLRRCGLVAVDLESSSCTGEAWSFAQDFDRRKTAGATRGNPRFVIGDSWLGVSDL